MAEDGRLLATRTAVIAGITYNFLPFMALPLYVALEKIDRRLVEAATDLYASRRTAFRKVTLPLALPGVFAGTLLRSSRRWATSSTPSSWAPRSST